MTTWNTRDRTRYEMVLRFADGRPDKLMCWSDRKTWTALGTILRRDCLVVSERLGRRWDKGDAIWCRRDKGSRALIISAEEDGPELGRLLYTGRTKRDAWAEERRAAAV